MVGDLHTPRYFSEILLIHLPSNTLHSSFQIFLRLFSLHFSRDQQTSSPLQVDSSSSTLARSTNYPLSRWLLVSVEGVCWWSGQLHPGLFLSTFCARSLGRLGSPFGHILGTSLCTLTWYTSLLSGCSTRKPDPEALSPRIDSSSKPLKVPLQELFPPFLIFMIVIHHCFYLNSRLPKLA